MSTTEPMSEQPYALQHQSERKRRRRMLQEKHVRSLTVFVEAIRAERGLSNEVPHFDPLDGGVMSTILGLMELPGPKTVASGFISRNNPDPTARNMCAIQDRSGIPRRSIALWNIVPWSVDLINAQEMQDAEPYLIRLIKLLPELRVIVLFGRRAQSQRDLVRRCFDGEILEAWHTSGQALNPHPSRREEIVSILKRAHASAGTASGR